MKKRKNIVYSTDEDFSFKNDKSEIIITLGAGDISEKVESIKKLILQNVI